LEKGQGKPEAVQNFMVLRADAKEIENEEVRPFGNKIMTLMVM
jgi:hypothetical protein